jgi:hypothetical protein
MVSGWTKALGLALKKKIVSKFTEVKIGSNMTESSKEGCFSKRAVLPMTMIPVLSWRDSGNS